MVYEYLNQCLALFTGTLDAILGQPLLRFFLLSGVVLAVISLFAAILRAARKM